MSDFSYHHTYRRNKAEKIYFDYSGISKEALIETITTPLKIVYQGQTVNGRIDSCDYDLISGLLTYHVSSDIEIPEEDFLAVLEGDN